jgi:hypothetical protein
MRVSVRPTSGRKKKKRISPGYPQEPESTEMSVDDETEFIHQRRPYRLSANDVRKALQSVEPEPIRIHFVIIDGRRFPTKQAFSAATGIDRTEFGPAMARQHLVALGFEAGRDR